MSSVARSILSSIKSGLRSVFVNPSSQSYRFNTITGYLEQDKDCQGNTVERLVTTDGDREWFGRQFPATEGKLSYNTECKVFTVPQENDRSIVLSAAIGPCKSKKFPWEEPAKHGPCQLVVRTQEDRQAGTCQLSEYSNGSFYQSVSRDIIGRPKKQPRSLWLYRLNFDSATGEKLGKIARASLKDHSRFAMYDSKPLLRPGVPAAWLSGDGDERTLCWVSEMSVSTVRGCLPKSLRFDDPRPYVISHTAYVLRWRSALL